MCQHANVERRDVIFSLTYAGSREVSLVIRMELNLVGFIEEHFVRLNAVRYCIYIKCLAYEKSKPLFDMTILSPKHIFIRKQQHTLIYCRETYPDLLFINMLKGDRTTRLNVHNVQGS